MTNIKDLSLEAKKSLFKALLGGTITKDDLTHGSDVLKLLNQKHCLVHIIMGETHSYSFDGNKIEESEFIRLSKLSSALGGVKKEYIARFNIGIVPSPFNIPLANSEEEIDLF